MTNLQEKYGKRIIADLIEEISEEICQNLCKYNPTIDDDYQCEYTEAHEGFCPLDLLRG